MPRSYPNAEFGAKILSIKKVAKILHKASYRAENFCTQYLYDYFLQCMPFL